MLTLYHSPGACSLAPHILLHETDTPHEGVRVDLKTKRTASGQDYLTINPKGAVPALDTGDGSGVLTENGVVLQYIAELAGGDDLLPPRPDMKHYRVLEMVNYVATELHKGFGPLFNPASSEETKQAARDLLAKKFTFIQDRLGSNDYMFGDAPVIADFYLFVILNWTGMHKIDLEWWPKLAAFRSRVAARPAVLKTMRAEGLVQPEPAS